VTVTEKRLQSAPSDVWAALIEPTTYPRWLVGAKRIREVSPSWPDPESWFEHVVGFGPVQVADRTTVRAVDPPTILELLVRARPFLTATVRFEVRSRPVGCVLRMTETPEGIYKIVSAVAGPLLRRRNERSLNRLAAVVDERTDPRFGLAEHQVLAAGDAGQ
jgi:uncharacterized protein YndB with AHSA1/START domain